MLITFTNILTPQDLLLPRSLVSRIARGVLPPNTSLQKDAILALAKSATVFISHLASEANEATDRKTVQSQDVIKAINELEMDSVMGIGAIGADGRSGGRLEREVEKYEESIRGKRKGYRDKVKARESAGAASASGGNVNGSGDADAKEAEDRDRGHESKRIRRDTDGETGEDSTMHDSSFVTVPEGDLASVNGGPSTQGQALHPSTNGHGSHSISKTSNGREAEDNDQTETDPDNDSEHDEEDEDDDDDDDDENEDEANEDDDEDDNKIDTDAGTGHDTSRRKAGGVLAPNGREEVGESDEDDDDSDL